MMGLLEIIGFVGAFFTGFVMGLTGSGGSILSIPVLAYLFNFDEKTATAYSLFIVGTTALFGSFRIWGSNLISKTLVWSFGIPSIIGVLTVRWLIIPYLPEVLFYIRNFEFTRRMLIFGLFGFMMILAVYFMLRKSNTVEAKDENEEVKFHPMMIVGGFFLGSFMGMVGAGGGFLMVPAMMWLVRLPIKKAVSTSLVVVCMNTLIGFFLGDFFLMKVDWNFLLTFMIISFIGIYVGGILNHRINPDKLKKGFAYFVMAMAVFVFSVEFLI